MRNAIPKSLCFTAVAVLCLAASALAKVQVQLVDAENIGGFYTSPYPTKADGVPVTVIAEELMAVPFAARVVPMPEAPWTAVLGIDLLAIAGLMVAGRKSMVRSRTLRA